MFLIEFYLISIINIVLITFIVYKFVNLFKFSYLNNECSKEVSVYSIKATRYEYEIPDSTSLKR